MRCVLKVGFIFGWSFQEQIFTVVETLCGAKGIEKKKSVRHPMKVRKVSMKVSK